MAKKRLAALSFSKDELAAVKHLFAAIRRRQLPGVEILKSKTLLRAEAKFIRAAARLEEKSEFVTPAPRTRRVGRAPRARAGGRDYVPRAKCPDCQGAGALARGIYGVAQAVMVVCSQCSGTGLQPLPTPPPA